MIESQWKQQTVESDLQKLKMLELFDISDKLYYLICFKILVDNFSKAKFENSET